MSARKKPARLFFKVHVRRIVESEVAVYVQAETPSEAAALARSGRVMGEETLASRTDNDQGQIFEIPLRLIPAAIRTLWLPGTAPKRQRKLKLGGA